MEKEMGTTTLRSTHHEESDSAHEGWDAESPGNQHIQTAICINSQWLSRTKTGGHEGSGWTSPCEPRFVQEELEPLYMAISWKIRIATRWRDYRRPVTRRSKRKRESFPTVCRGYWLRKHHVKTIFRPTKSIQQYLKSAKHARAPLEFMLEPRSHQN